VLKYILTENYFYHRRARILSSRLADLLPPHANVLDLGCGDGFIAKKIVRLRPDVTIRGVDVLVRKNAHIAVDTFDGKRLPYGDNSFEVVLLVDVMHHSERPEEIVQEAARVANRFILIKDHQKTGLGSVLILRYLDWVGNRPHGVACPGTYWSAATWFACFSKLGLTVEEWKTGLRIFPFWISWLFDRQMNVLGKLSVP
jgi:SAM-dependent methyltransferase